VEVEKEIEVPDKETQLMNLFNNINFDFDKAMLTTVFQAVLDQIAYIMKDSNAGDRFLISGFTDTHRSELYNQRLTESRARVVVDAVVSRGVPKSNIKVRYSGEKITTTDPAASDEIRHDNHRVTIKIIANTRYWEYLQERLH
jgi:outer membrane protein OmpA-like peptidoglycan-associated protein